MPVTLTIDGSLVQAMPAHRVYLRASWGACWSEPVQFLYCDSLKWCAAPDLPLARLVWRFGRGMQAGDSRFANYSRVDFVNVYVRIEVGPVGAPIGVWHGVILEEDDDRGGALFSNTASPLPTGTETITAVGLEFLLRRATIRSSWVLDADSGIEYEVHRGLTVNSDNSRLPAGDLPQTPPGNRTSGVGPRGVRMFTDDLTAGEYWSTRDVVRYLLTYHTPANSAGLVQVPFVMGARAELTLPIWDRPEKDLHNVTVDRVLSDLIDRGRFVGYYFDVDGDDVRLQAFPFNAELIVLPGDELQLPNNIQVILDFDGSLRVEKSLLKRAASHNFEQVVVQGARVRCCFSLSAVDGTLVRDWTDAQEDTYNAGFSAADELDVNERLTAMVRQSGAISRVYAQWKLPDDWDGLVAEAIGGELVAYFDPEGDGTPDPFYRPDLRFLRSLPIKAEYTEGAAIEWAKPMAFLKISDVGEADDETERYQHVEKIASMSASEGLGDGMGLRWSAHCRMADHDAAIVLHVSGKPQHVLASAEFVPLADIDDLHPAELDWHDNLIVTVAIDADRFVEAAYPAAPPAGDAIRQLRIDVGTRARLDYVAPGTVTGIEGAGELVYETDGYYARDDRARMADVARIAWEWYSVPRQALSLELTVIYADLHVGDLVVQLGTGPLAEAVNAVVTLIEWDLQRGRTRIGTDFAELDLRQLF